MTDRVDIGLTTKAQEILSRLVEMGWFGEGQDVARFCLAYSIRSHVALGETTGVETRWSSGNFDPSGEIRAVVMALYPESETPVRLMQHLVNEGLLLVGDLLEKGHLTLDDLWAETLR